MGPSYGGISKPRRSEPLDTTEDEDGEESIDIGTGRHEPIRGTFSSSSLPTLHQKSRWERFCDFLVSLFENCINFWCCCVKPPGRSRACGWCYGVLTFIVFFSVILVVLAAKNPEKTREVYYTFFKAPRTEYEKLQAAIASNGDVCELPILPRFNAGCSSPAALYGRSGVPHLRKIIEEGTRVSSMERTCEESIIPIGDFQWGCFDESWFSFASVAYYDYNVGWPVKDRIFNTPKAVFLIRDPFDSAIDLYYRKYKAHRPLNPLTSSNPFSNHDDFIEFAKQELKEWSQFFKQMLDYQVEHIQHMEVVWYDDIDSYQELKNATTPLFEFLRDEFYYPSIPQSQKCLETAKFDAFELTLPTREVLFSEKERKTLCPLVFEYWEPQRWGGFCNSTLTT